MVLTNNVAPLADRCLSLRNLAFDAVRCYLHTRRSRLELADEQSTGRGRHGPVRTDQ